MKLALDYYGNTVAIAKRENRDLVWFNLKTEGMEIGLHMGPRVARKLSRMLAKVADSAAQHSQKVRP